MAFVTDKEELKPGLIIFRRSDVRHRNWYCRVKLPKADRYKTISLKTADINAARSMAFDADADVRFRLKHDVPVFNRPFRDVAKEYLAAQEARAKRGEISAARVKKMRAVIEGPLDAYVGSTQVHLIGDELWTGYPAWRRENGAGRNRRNGVREVSADMARRLAAQDAAARIKALQSRGIRRGKSLAAASAVVSAAATAIESAAASAAPATAARREVAFISDATIRFEMSIFGGVMNYSVKKRYVPASQRFDDRPKLKVMRRDEFTTEEYRKLHTVGRAWIEKASKPSSTWYRTTAYNFILIMCNTGMRPSEAKNLRWRDITPAKDREGRDMVVLFVQGKGKSRKLVAPQSVSTYLERIRAISKATRPEDRVFTTIDGEPALSLYKALIEDILTEAELREGPHGIARSTYSFRHTYATFRLGEGVDVYFLAEQMGTSVKMIEDHYGHVNTIRHADRVLTGMEGWEPVAAGSGETPVAEKADAKARAKAKAAQAAKAKQPSKPSRRSKR